MTEHKLDQRVLALSGAIQRRKQLLTDALRPSGQRPPFTQQLSEPDALAFWQRNRNTSLGKEVLQRMKPEDIMELDLALARMGEGSGLQG